MKPAILGAGFALLGAADLAWIDFGLWPAALAPHAMSAPVVQPVVVQPVPAPPVAGQPRSPARPNPPSTSEGGEGAASSSATTEVVLHFEVNARDPKDISSPDLAAVVALLASNSALRVSIDGHSDRNGSSAYNDELSRQRADAVAEALVARGVERSRISSHAHGARAPVATGNDPESLARNRRVEVRVERRKP